jgi:hypothetical protein
MMTAEVSLHELGPVDYVVGELPAGASSFTGEVAAELQAMAGSGTIRVIDVLILTKDADGTSRCPGVTDGSPAGLRRFVSGPAEGPQPHPDKVMQHGSGWCWA